MARQRSAATKRSRKQKRRSASKKRASRPRRTGKRAVKKRSTKNNPKKAVKKTPKKAAVTKIKAPKSAAKTRRKKTAVKSRRKSAPARGIRRRPKRVSTKGRRKRARRTAKKVSPKKRRKTVEKEAESLDAFCVEESSDEFCVGEIELNRSYSPVPDTDTSISEVSDTPGQDGYYNSTYASIYGHYDSDLSDSSYVEVVGNSAKDSRATSPTIEFVKRRVLAKDEVFEVEKILESKMTKGTELFRVKWRGYPTSDCTWEPIDNLTNCQRALNDFLDSKQYKIEKIVKERTVKVGSRRGEVEYYVKWEGYPSSDNTWEPRSELMKTAKKTIVAYEQKSKKAKSEPKRKKSSRKLRTRKHPKARKGKAPKSSSRSSIRQTRSGEISTGERNFVELGTLAQRRAAKRKSSRKAK